MSRYIIREVDGSNGLYRMILRDLHEELFGDSAPQIVPEEGYWWIAWFKGKPVGFAGLRLAASTPGTGYLHRAGVEPFHRGHRLQVRFIRAREAKAKKLGLDRMVTDTTDNERSANTLMRAGYRLFETQYKWAFSHSLYWEKSLRVHKP